ncbi:MAG: response regulator transcription factor [Dehalococcoidia bacterium]
MRGSKAASLKLTKRQREVFALVADGFSNREIADRLGISLDGAKWHVSELLGRLEVENREQLAAVWPRYRREPASPWIRRLALTFFAAAGAIAVTVSALFIAVSFRREDPPPLNSLPTVEPSATIDPTSCPVDQGICNFAIEVERVYREGDLHDLMSSKSTYYPEVGVLQAASIALGGPLKPRVIAIGCPVDPSVAECSDAFSLVLTSYPDSDSAREHRVLLGFLRDGDGLPIVTIDRLVGGVTLFNGGVALDCRASGRLATDPCQGTRFFSFTTSPELLKAPTPVPAPTPATDPLAGVDITQLQPGMQATIGYDTVVYYSEGCSQCGRPRIPNLYRLYRNSAGELITDDLFGPLLAKSGGYPNSVAADWDHGHLLVQICATGYCGGEGDPSPDATIRLFRSRDGGVTFTEESAAGFPVESYLVGFAHGEAIVSVTEHRGVEYVQRYFLYPSNTPLTPPPGIGNASPYADHDGSFGWLNYQPTTGYYDEGGNLLVPTSPGHRLVYVPPLGAGWLALWSAEGAGGQTYGVYDGDAHLLRAFATPSFADLRGNQLPDGVLVGNVQLDEPFGFGLDGGSDACKTSQPIYAALVNWVAGTIHPIFELGDCGEDGHKFVNHISAIATVRVNTPGDCLNLRAESATSSASLGCFADGVLLPKWVEHAPAPVPGWVPVLTPDLRTTGWVSEAFVLR